MQDVQHHQEGIEQQVEELIVLPVEDVEGIAHTHHILHLTHHIEVVTEMEVRAEVVPEVENQVGLVHHQVFIILQRKFGL